MKATPLLFLALALSAAAQTAPVPVNQEPHHHLVLQNQYTRVYDVVIPPHQATAWHRHDNDYVAVIVTASEVQNEVAGKSSPTGTGRAGVGEVRFTTAPVTHRLVNKGNATSRNITIEILNKKPVKEGESNEERGLEVGHGGLSDTVVDNREVRVQEVQIAPGGMLHKHTHKFPFLVVALSDAELHNMPQGKPATEAHLKTGDVRWGGPGATHEVMNMGKQEAHFVEVEFK